MKLTAGFAFAALSICSVSGNTTGFDADAILSPSMDYTPSFFWMWKDRLEEKRC